MVLLSLFHVYNIPLFGSFEGFGSNFFSLLKNRPNIK